MSSQNKKRKAKRNGFGKYSVKIKHMKIKRVLFYNSAKRQEDKKEMQKECKRDIEDATP